MSELSCVDVLDGKELGPDRDGGSMTFLNSDLTASS